MPLDGRTRRCVVLVEATAAVSVLCSDSSFGSRSKGVAAQYQSSLSNRIRPPLCFVLQGLLVFDELNYACRPPAMMLVDSIHLAFTKALKSVQDWQ